MSELDSDIIPTRKCLACNRLRAMLEKWKGGRERRSDIRAEGEGEREEEEEEEDKDILLLLLLLMTIFLIIYYYLDLLKPCHIDSLPLSWVLVGVSL